VIAYLDTSVVLRIVLEQPLPLDEWTELHAGVSSMLLPVESHRSLDRLWHLGHIVEEKLAAKSAAIDVLMKRLDLLQLDEHVLAIASRPLPVALGARDALALATAIVYRDAQNPDERPVLFATHDVALARAAQAMHFDVIGDTSTLLTAGARMVRLRDADTEPDGAIEWDVLADPEGNEFCVFSPEA